MNKFDCIVIGYGPCGISTAIYLKRYGYEPLVIGKDRGALEKAHLIENYYGIEPIRGTDLADKGIRQAKELNIEVITDEVLAIEVDDGYDVVCKAGVYHAPTVMLSVGAARNKFPLAERYEGIGVSYCATCDGFFFRKKKTALIGSGEYMLHELEVLKNLIPDLTVFTNGEELTVDVGNLPVVREKIIAFTGEEHLESIITTNAVYPVSGCFIANGSASGFTLAKHLGIALRGNYIQVNEDKMTNLPGIFAGGDCTGGLLQVSKAISDGAIAATAISKYLKRS